MRWTAELAAMTVPSLIRSSTNVSMSSLDEPVGGSDDV